MKNIIYISLLFLFIFLPSCGPDLTSAQEVIKLQVLNIKSDKPELHPGDTVKSEVLIAKPEGNTEEYHTVWLLCDPKSDGASGTSFATCMNPQNSNLIGAPSINTTEYSAKIPEDVLSKKNLESKYMYVLFVMCKADLETCTKSMSPDENTDMNSNPFSSGVFNLTLKRIRVVSKDTEIRNNNPKIEGIYLNDKLIDSDSIKLSDDDVFKVKIDKSSYDKKTDPNGELIDETIATAWKSNKGKFEFYLTNQEKDEDLDDLDENPFSTPDEIGDGYKLYIIATDARGGADWRILKVTP